MRGEVIKIRAESKNVENRKTTEKSMKQSCLTKRINKMDKPLSTLIKERENAQLSILGVKGKISLQNLQTSKR